MTTLNVTVIAPGYVMVKDTGWVRTYYMPEATYNALDKTSTGVLTRLQAAAEFVLDGMGEMMKPYKMEATLTQFIKLRAGAAPAKAAIPAAVLAAVAALNSYVTA